MSCSRAFSSCFNGLSPYGASACTSLRLAEVNGAELRPISHGGDVQSIICPAGRATCHSSPRTPGRFMRRSNNTSPLLRSRDVVRASSEPRGSTGEEEGEDGGEDLAAKFARFVIEAQHPRPLEHRRPTALMPPTTVVQAQMDALMRNDWPEIDSGIKTAFAFAMPARVEEMIAGQVRPAVAAARTWDAAERYLNVDEFGELLREPSYRPLLNCVKWEVASPMTFHGPGDKRAVQAVKVSSSREDGSVRQVAFTFCLEKVLVGAYKGCWMVVGLRQGDYANV